MIDFKKLLKLAVGLAIPAGFLWLFISAQKQADVEVKNYHEFQKTHPPAEKITLDNYELKEIDDGNHLKWHLEAKQGTMEPASKDVDLKEVKVKYFDGTKVKMSLCAPSGVANETTHMVLLTSSPKELVECEGTEGSAKLLAKKVELNKKNDFTATGGVTIVYPGVAKVTGNTCTGSLAHDTDLKNFKIVGNTHAMIGHM
jgi:hypothetical protein